MADWDGDGVNDRWPQFYDNYFVPRGYAVLLAQSLGTGYTEHGCSQNGAAAEVAAQKAVIDWLNGRVAGYGAARLDAPPKPAAWHNGSAAMIGEGLDGALATGTAATGVAGLKTIVPMNALVDWYGWRNMGGAGGQFPNMPSGMSANHMFFTPLPPGVSIPNRRAVCAAVHAEMNDDANLDLGDGDAHGDYNSFWRERDYRPGLVNIKAAVFATHGLQEDFIRADHVAQLWSALKAAGVPRKLWLHRGGHEEPLEARRARWVDTLHRWFDHWLYGIDNGIMSEPAVAIEDEPDVWHDYADWPVPGTRDVDVYLRASADPAAPGTIGPVAGGGSADSRSYVTAIGGDDSYAANQLTPQTNRIVFLSRPLTRDVRLSGGALADLAAALDAPQTTVGLMIHDYGPSTPLSILDEGIRNLTTRSCWGVSGTGEPCSPLGSPCTAPASTVDHACLLDVEKLIRAPASRWYVSRSVLDTSNRDSLWYADAKPVTAGQQYRFRIPITPHDYVFKAGHQIGLIAMSSDSSLAIPRGAHGVRVTVNTRTSKVTLPIVGGYEALAAAGAFEDPTAPVGGTVAPTLALTLGAPAAFGAFAPGSARTYEATTSANVISSAGDAALSITDPGANAPGHLINGAFALAAPLQVSAGGAFAPVPATVQSWSGPTSNDTVAVRFRQSIASSEPLRTGAYAKTLTFTHSTSTP